MNQKSEKAPASMGAESNPSSSESADKAEHQSAPPPESEFTLPKSVFPPPPPGNEGDIIERI